MKKILILCLGITILSCANDDSIEEIVEVPEENLNRVELNVNGENSAENVINIKSHSSCNGDLYVTVTSKKK